jgi:hypothetical protein
MTRGPVLTAGLDFAYTLDKFHCRESPSEAARWRRTTRLTGCYNAAACFSAGSVKATAASGAAVLTDGALSQYRTLFEREFGGNSRVFGLAGDGLALGVSALPLDAAMALLHAPAEHAPATSSERAPVPKERVAAFIEREVALLDALVACLTGDAGEAQARRLLRDADYIWAHFPDAASLPAWGTPAGQSFLNRARVEAAFFKRWWLLALHSTR